MQELNSIQHSNSLPNLPNLPDNAAPPTPAARTPSAPNLGAPAVQRPPTGLLQALDLAVPRPAGNAASNGIRRSNSLPALAGPSAPPAAARTHSPSSVGAPAVAATPASQEIYSILESWLAPEAGSDVQKHYRAVAKQLMVKGVTASQLKQDAEKLQNMDLYLAAARGVFKAFLPMAARMAFDHTPGFFAQSDKIGEPIAQATLTAGEAAALEELATIVTDTLMSVWSSNTPPYFLEPDTSKLAEPVKALREKLAPATRSELTFNLLGEQRNTIRGAWGAGARTVTEAVTGSPNAGATADIIVGNSLRLFTEPAAEMARIRRETTAGRNGLLWVLGQKDGVETYMHARTATVGSIAWSGLQKALHLPVSAIRQFPQYARSIVSPAKLTEYVTNILFPAGEAAVRDLIKGRLESHGLPRNWADTVAQNVSNLAVEGSHNVVTPILSDRAGDLSERLWRATPDMRVVLQAMHRALPTSATPKKLLQAARRQLAETGSSSRASDAVHTAAVPPAESNRVSNVAKLDV